MERSSCKGEYHPHQQGTSAKLIKTIYILQPSVALSAIHSNRVDSTQGGLPQSHSDMGSDVPAAETSSPSLLTIPLELRDMIYAELSVHRLSAVPTHTSSNVHGYGRVASSTDDAVDPLVQTGQLRPYNLIDGTINTTLQLICHQIRAEILDFSARVNHTKAELDLKWVEQRCIPTWMCLPLIRRPASIIDVDVTLRIYCCNMNTNDAAIILEFIRRTLLPIDPARRSTVRSPRINESVTMDIGTLRLVPVCHDIYTPNTFPKIVLSLQHLLVTVQPRGLLKTFGRIVDIHGVRINTDNAVVPGYWHDPRIVFADAPHYAPVSGFGPIVPPDWDVDQAQ